MMKGFCSVRELSGKQALRQHVQEKCHYPQNCVRTALRPSAFTLSLSKPPNIAGNAQLGSWSFTKSSTSYHWGTTLCLYKVGVRVWLLAFEMHLRKTGLYPNEPLWGNLEIPLLSPYPHCWSLKGVTPQSPHLRGRPPALQSPQASPHLACWGWTVTWPARVEKTSARSWLGIWNW